MLKLDTTIISDHEALGFVLRGLEDKYSALGAQISAVKAQMAGSGDNKVRNSPTKAKAAQKQPAKAPVKVKGKITPEGRKRIAAAQKARWAEIRKKAAKATKALAQRPPAVEEPELAAAGD